jgi:hypothetical protein
MRIILCFGLAVMLSGCAALPRIEWTSTLGEKCFSSAKSNQAKCYSKCQDIYCLTTCDVGVNYAMAACTGQNNLW